MESTKKKEHIPVLYLLNDLRLFDFTRFRAYCRATAPLLSLLLLLAAGVAKQNMMTLLFPRLLAIMADEGDVPAPRRVCVCVSALVQLFVDESSHDLIPPLVIQHVSVKSEIKNK